MQLVAKAKIITPIITKKRLFHLKGCQVQIIEPKKRYVTKTTIKNPLNSYNYIAYLGKLEIRYNCNKKEKAKRKLSQLLQITSIGRFKSDGYGRIELLEAEIQNSDHKKKIPRNYAIHIRKGLPHNLTKKQQELIRYCLLHDLVNTSYHPSKIYVEIPLKNKRLLNRLKRHHDKTKDSLIQRFQKYDRIASIISRKTKSPKNNRYNWNYNWIRKKIDFETLAERIAQLVNNVYKLYDFIYNNKELESIVESMTFGHSSLKEHLLLCANLALNEMKNE